MGDLVEGRDIGVELAGRIIAAAQAEAERQGLRLSIVVADRAGNPVATARMDGAQLGSYEIACDKAFSAAVWNDRTGEMGKISVPGEGDWGIATTMRGRMIVFAGGVPVRTGGEQIGALGISGALSEEDEAVGLAALASLDLEG
ncbi:MAG: GlcG/HbpS family heme-binding protein [Gaiellales bacterium]